MICNVEEDNCVKCSETFCNVQSGKSYVSCLACDNKSDPNCGYTQIDSDDFKICEALLGRENLCFSFSNDTRYIRGCLNDYPDLKSECFEINENCQICDTDECNFEKMVKETCIICDSSVDENCEKLSEIDTPGLCGEGPIDRSGCYLFNKGNLRTNPLNPMKYFCY